MLTERDRMHLKKMQELFSFAHLHPPPEVYEINVPEEDFFMEIQDNKRRRKIYYRVCYTEEEESKIQEIKSKMVDAGIFENYPEEIILKHIYSSDFDTNKCLERLFKLQSFLNHEVITAFTEDTVKCLESGVIYTYGQDRSMRPLVIIQAHKFDYSKKVEQNFNCVYFLMLIVLGFRTVPFHAEKYILLFDFDKMNLMDIPYKYLYEVMTAMNLYYCSNVEKVFAYNAKGISSLWSLAKRFIPQHAQKKIVFISSDKRADLLEYIDPFELEKKYGGKLENLTEFWPPKCTNEEFDAIHLLKLKEESGENQTEDELFSICNDIDYFKEESGGLCGEATCHCRTF